jgi:hypothetical protein
MPLAAQTAAECSPVCLGVPGSGATGAAETRVGEGDWAASRVPGGARGLTSSYRLWCRHGLFGTFPPCAASPSGICASCRLVACGRHSSTTCARRVQTGGPHPVNLATNQAKGSGLSILGRVLPVEPDAMRVARPDRRRLAGLTPLGKRETNPCVLSDGVCAS